ncbi:bacteriophage Gp15 family protein, partial [Lactococcus lactis]|uniref:Gp15 family bacteriophage protein n=1 Tax=Lactococcus lactis TaxID=1358 RepID=UPI0038CF5042
EELNDEHDVNGTKYPINVSFDNILNLIDMLKEKKLSDRLKLDFAIRMLFGKDTDLVKLSGEEQLEIFNCIFEKYVMQGQVEKTAKYDRQGNEMPSYEADTKQNYSLKYD